LAVTAGSDPLHLAREEALLLLSRLVLLVWTPIFVVGAFLRWDEHPQRALLLLVALGVPLTGWVLRRPGWSAESRARVAILLIMAISLPALLVNGPRALSTTAIAVVLTLAMLFYRMQTALAILSVYAVVVVTGVLMSAQGLVQPAPADELLSLTYRLITLGVMFNGLWFGAHVLQATVRIYRDAQEAAAQRLQAMLDAQREAELLQRRELVNTVTTGMTHDLANVIQVVTATAELLREEPLRLEAQEAVDDLQRVGDEAAVRLRAILTVGRSTSRTDDHSSIEEPFARLDLMLRPLLGRRITLALDIAAAVPAAAIDRGRLEQVLLNLALNARDAMPEGGTLRIAARGADRGVVIDVADSGHGIPLEERARIWEPFYTSKPAGRGTGLGLAMVARILERARGRVQVTSALGVGTTFSVWLPAVVTST
jgi:signal transduction histidine kinase